MMGGRDKALHKPRTAIAHPTYSTELLEVLTEAAPGRAIQLLFAKLMW